MSNIVTVIIPCYRGEDRVGNIIKAVLNQTYRNLEILVVGNGPDQEGQRRIVESIMRIDNRIRYLSVSSSGVSRARNFGLENACGDWVAFVDDDDLVPNDWLSRFAVHFDKLPDVIAGGIRYLPFGSTDAVNSDVCVSSDGMYSRNPKEFLPVFLDDMAVRYSPCSKVLRLEFLNRNKIRFCEDMTIYEDSVFSLGLALKAETMCIIPQTGYLYVSRKGSAMGRYHECMPRALEMRRCLLCKVAARSGMDEVRLNSFGRAQVVADSLDEFLNAFRRGTPYDFSDKVKFLAKLFSDGDFVNACTGFVPPFANKPLLVYVWLFRIRARVLGVFLFELMFFVRDWVRRLV